MIRTEGLSNGMQTKTDNFRGLMADFQLRSLGVTFVYGNGLGWTRGGDEQGTRGFLGPEKKKSELRANEIMNQKEG